MGKRVIAVLMSFLMVLSLMPVVPSEAKANYVDLPQVNGLYLSLALQWKGEKAITDVDEAGNQVLVGADGNYIRYAYQNSPEYLTEGIEEGWGPDVSGTDLKIWFDYIKDGKVIHVKADELTVTELDGKPTSEVSFYADTHDDRVVDADFTVSEKSYLVTYSGADENNKMVIMTSYLQSGFFWTKEASLSTRADNYFEGICVPENGSRTVYMAMMLYPRVNSVGKRSIKTRVSYTDEKTGESVVLEDSEDGFSDFVSTRIVRDDPAYVVEEITLKGTKKNSTGFQNYSVQVEFDEVGDGEIKTSTAVMHHIEITPYQVLKCMPADRMRVAANRLDPEFNADLSSDENFYSVGESPIYTAFRYVDGSGDLVRITDPTDITVYRVQGGTLTKADKDEVDISVEDYLHAVLKVVPKLHDGTQTTYVIGYKDIVPDINGQKISVTASKSGDIDMGLYSSSTVSDSNYLTELTTDGEKPINIYAAFGKESGATSARVKSVQLKSARGDIYTKGISVDNSATVKDKDGEGILGGAAIKISKRVIDDEMVLTVTGEIEKNGVKSEIKRVVYIFYKEPDVKVSRILLNKKSATLKAGKKLKLTAFFIPQYASNTELTFTSSNKKYATVSYDDWEGEAVVKAKKAGIGHTVKITAKAKDGSGVKAVCKIKIKK